MSWCFDWAHIFENRKQTQHHTSRPGLGPVGVSSRGDLVQTRKRTTAYKPGLAKLGRRPGTALAAWGPGRVATRPRLRALLLWCGLGVLWLGPAPSPVLV